MFSIFNQSAWTIAALAAAGVASTAQAGVIASVDPLGNQTSVQLSGAAGVAQNPSRWFSVENGEAQYTAWANQHIDFTASLSNTPANYRVGVTAKNFTSLRLPDNYSQFKVAVNVNGSFVDNLFIDASDNQWNTAWIDVGQLASDTTLTLDWLNDSYSQNNYDANFGVGAIQFAPVVTNVTQLSSAVPAVPAPASGMLFAMALGLAAPRRARVKSISSIPHTR